ncbi:MAG: patatin-like phospholipase family protein [Glaciimonas sp.]|nr:patatin-like phospholipase family protein [Glaciimonas sp.]
MQITPITAQILLNRRYQNIVFAGGGNRCWWQAGLIEKLASHPCWQVKQFVGASAGAAIATAFAANTMNNALNDCMQRFKQNAKNIEWGKRPFMMPDIWREWTTTFLNKDSFSVVKNSGIALNLALTRPIKGLPLSVSALIALGLYSSKKYISKNYHSGIPHAFGFRSEHIDLAQCNTLEQAHQLLMATAAAVPIAPAVSWEGRPALDGGFYDSIPLPKAPFSHPNTLILLTRYRPKQPHLFEFNGCTYIQPSNTINAVNFDCTNADNVEIAYAHGITDGRALLAG